MSELLIESSVLIGMILMLRKCFAGRVRYCYIYALWGLVALRLLLPVTLVDTPVSVMNVWQNVLNAKESEIPGETSWQEYGARSNGGLFLNDAVKGLEQNVGKTVTDNSEKAEVLKESEKAVAKDVLNGEQMQNLSADERELGYIQKEKKATVPWIGIVWITGAVICAVAMFFSNLIQWRRLRRERELFQKAEKKSPAVYLTEEFAAPCLYGVFSSAIYIPKQLVRELSEEKLEQIILHERMHYKHWDHIWVLVRGILVVVYWFYPLVWLSVILSKKDAELACDEAVIIYLGEEKRFLYGEVLLEAAKLGGKKKMAFWASSMSREGKELAGRLCAIRERRGYKRRVLFPLGLIIVFTVGMTFTGQSHQGKATEADISDNVKENLKAAKENILTMDQLLLWEKEDAFGRLCYKDLVGYENCETIEEEYNGGELAIRMEYEGMRYRLQVPYDHDKTIMDFYLCNETTGEIRTIYSHPSFQMGLFETPVEVMLEHETLLDDTIRYELPQGLLDGVCYMDYASVSGGAMRLFLNEEDRKNGVYGYTNAPVWSSAGGVTQTYSIVSDEKAIPHYAWRIYYGNGRGAVRESAIETIEGGELEFVSGCDGVASVEGITFHKEIAKHFGVYSWYQKPLGEENAELPDKNTIFPKKVWLGCLTEEGDASGFGYVFFLDADRYTKEEMIRLLRSVRVVGEGNIVHENLLWKVKEIVPEAVWEELAEHGVVKTPDIDIHSVGNAESAPTLRLDFCYDYEGLYQYRSKGYGFIEELPEEKVTLDEAQRLVKQFAEVFLDKKAEPVLTEDYSGYETEDYATYKDASGDTYLVWLSHGMLIQYDKKGHR